jgi:hypothetical protein
MHGWHRWKLGWLYDAQIACVPRVGRRTAQVMPLERAGGVKAVVVRAGQAAYVAEVRQRLAEDRGICQKGVLAYSVDLRPPPRWWALPRHDAALPDGSYRIRVPRRR